MTFLLSLFGAIQLTSVESIFSIIFFTLDGISALIAIAGSIYSLILKIKNKTLTKDDIQDTVQDIKDTVTDLKDKIDDN